jgi:DNA mismatch endonuclease (patch repair protein)
MSRVLVGPDGRPLDLDAATSVRLGKIRQKDTAPEQLVRKLVAGLGVRYTLRNRDLPGSPDLANRKRRWTIFVHGCFWHSHRGCMRATIPKRNREFWVAKFEANRRRDERAVARLRRMGLAVSVVWECDAELRPRVVAERLARFLHLATRQARGKRDA